MIYIFPVQSLEYYFLLSFETASVTKFHLKVDCLAFLAELNSTYMRRTVSFLAHGPDCHTEDLQVCMLAVVRNHSIVHVLFIYTLTVDNHYGEGARMPFQFWCRVLNKYTQCCRSTGEQRRADLHPHSLEI